MTQSHAAAQPPRKQGARKIPARASTKPPFGKPLTDREIEILALVAAGLTSAQIERRLFLSKDTVKTHLDRTFFKLGAMNRSHAVALAYRSGLFGKRNPAVRPFPDRIMPERLGPDAR